MSRLLQVRSRFIPSREKQTRLVLYSLHSKKFSTNPYIQGDETHFGYTKVGVKEKEGKVKQIFEKVADSYDVMNDLMSGGLHRLWKDYLLEVSSVASIAKAIRRDEDNSGFRILDVAGGTGDVAFRFLEAADCENRAKSSGEDPFQVTVCDINSEMLRVGRSRAEKRFNGCAVINNSKALTFQEGNAQNLHNVEDCSFDMYTIAFGLRNVTDVDRALEEAHRVLKPGGRFMCLEFSHVPNHLLRTIYDAYSMHAIPLMGHYVAGDRDSYQYLVESIRKFPKQEELVRRIENASFKKVKYTNMTGGIVALHEGWKL